MGNRMADDNQTIQPMDYEEFCDYVYAEEDEISTKRYQVENTIAKLNKLIEKLEDIPAVLDKQVNEFPCEDFQKLSEESVGEFNGTIAQCIVMLRRAGRMLLVSALS